MHALMTLKGHGKTESLLCEQGLGNMKTHMSRLEKDRAAAAAKKAAGVASPAVESRVPSYMRQTAASVAMQKVSHVSDMSN